MHYPIAIYTIRLYTTCYRHVNVPFPCLAPAASHLSSNNIFTALPSFAEDSEIYLNRLNHCIMLGKRADFKFSSIHPLSEDREGVTSSSDLKFISTLDSFRYTESFSSNFFSDI